MAEDVEKVKRRQGPWNPTSKNVPPTLKAARKVAKTASGENDGEMEKLFRIMKTEEPMKFLAELRQMEKEHGVMQSRVMDHKRKKDDPGRGWGKKAPEAQEEAVDKVVDEEIEEPKEDVGEVAALELIEGWLKQNGVQDAGGS